MTKLFSRLLLASSLLACNTKKPELSGDARIKLMDSATTVALTKSIESTVTPKLAEGLTLKLWATDSLVADPVSIDIDDQGRIYYTRTNRQKNSEFDRGFVQPMRRYSLKPIFIR